jgi:G3E family GTPase
MNTHAKARYIMIGGFLGAGKTTAVARLAQHLTSQGFRVGLITNDQGSELVDTAMLRARGFATEEIPGGCFCCRFNSLTEAAERLTAAARPDVFIAEPVGSCTDLVATVIYPLRRIYGEDFSIAPVSVLVDPVRARRVLGLEEGAKFSSKVLYIYRKQLEEADILVINKIDLLDDSQRTSLHQALAELFPHAEIVEIAARESLNLEGWFEQITSSEQQARNPMEVDYDVYAEGESLLGWLNCTAQLSASEPFDASDLLKAIAARIQERLQSHEAEIAHLKMTLSPDQAVGGAIAAMSLVRNDLVPELSLELEDPAQSGQLIINLRAEAAPEQLREIVTESLQKLPGAEAKLDHIEAFRPGRPTPTHRFTSALG